MTETSQHTIHALHVAYVALMGMPYDEYRARNQYALATVRDELARLTGVDERLFASHPRLTPMF